MAYTVHDFKSGEKLYAAQLNEMDAQIAANSEEIEELKENGVGGEVIEKTGAMVMMSCDSSMEIEVSCDVAENVEIVHHGKNYVPTVVTEEVTKNGITIKPLGNGRFHFSGTATAWTAFPIADASNPFVLPAGDYVASSNFVVGSPRFYVEGLPTPYNTNPCTFTIAEQTEYTIAQWYVDSGNSVDGEFWAQIENGVVPTELEEYKGGTRSTILPVKLAAIDGVNILYTKSADVITAKASKSLAQMIEGIVDEKLKDYSPGVDVSLYGLPVLELTGNVSAMTKDNAVDLAYKYGDMTGTASVKWQGSSSVAYPKKNYTIKFDSAFEAKDGWGAQKKYCFKANYIDPTHARNVVSALLWGQVVASRETVDEYLSTCPNYGAVDGFPCIIMLNGEFLGLYTLNIPKDGWMLNFPTEGAAQQCILCAEGTGTYASEAFKAEEFAFEQGFAVEYITDENNMGWALTSLNNLIRACIASDGSDLDTTIAEMLDWDSVIDYLCFSMATANYDGITKNYLLYTRDGVKWHMGAYDLDCLFGNWWNGTKILPATGIYPVSSFTNTHRLFDLAWTYKQDAVKARYAQLMADALSEDNIATSFANFIGSIPQTVYAEEQRRWPGLNLTSVGNMSQITDWYRRRVQYVDSLLN